MALGECPMFMVFTKRGPEHYYAEKPERILIENLPIYWLE